MLDVTRRCVFYVSGFDPKGAGHYHALYKEEGARESQRDGWHLAVGPRRKQPGGSAAWEVEAELEGQQVQTHYEFMGWDDVVRRHWVKKTAVLWRDVIATTLFNLWHGALWKMFRLSWPPAVALFAPFVLVCVLLLGTPLLAVATALGVGQALGNVWLGLGAGALAAGALWQLGRWLEARYSMYWMMRSYTFTARQAQGQVPDLEARLDALAQRLVQRVREQQDDEVLLIGHSSGAIMAACVLARALRIAPDFLRGHTQVSFLTLGQWIPLLGLLPMAHQFRQELALIGGAQGLSWVDFSAPPDGCCFALNDALAACGIERAPAGVDLKILNPRFAAAFDPASYKKLRRNKFLMHFQYLCCSDRRGVCNYFEISAGPQTLKKRFAALPGIDGYRDLRPFG
jgi:hypothetical protein